MSETRHRQDRNLQLLSELQAFPRFLGHARLPSENADVLRDALPADHDATYWVVCTERMIFENFDKTLSSAGAANRFVVIDDDFPMEICLRVKGHDQFARATDPAAVIEAFGAFVSAVCELPPDAYWNWFRQGPTGV